MQFNLHGASHKFTHINNDIVHSYVLAHILYISRLQGHTDDIIQKQYYSL